MQKRAIEQGWRWRKAVHTWKWKREEKRLRRVAMAAKHSTRVWRGGDISWRQWSA